MTDTLHATAVALKGAGVLLLGPPGSGKSDLALRLIDRGAQLIADDRVRLSVRDGALLLAAPSTIAGRIEVRGVGLLALAHVDDVPARLAVDLARAPERLPEPESLVFHGIGIPLLRLSPFEASAPLKVELAVAHGLPED